MDPSHGYEHQEGRSTDPATNTGSTALHQRNTSSPVQIAGAPDMSRGKIALPSKPTEPGTLLIVVVYKLVTLVVCFVALAVDNCPYNIITRAQYYM